MTFFLTIKYYVHLFIKYKAKTISIILLHDYKTLAKYLANFSTTTESKVSYKLSKVIIQAARSKQSHAPN